MRLCDLLTSLIGQTVELAAHVAGAKHHKSTKNFSYECAEKEGEGLCCNAQVRTLSCGSIMVAIKRHKVVCSKSDFALPIKYKIDDRVAGQPFPFMSAIMTVRCKACAQGAG